MKILKLNIRNYEEILERAAKEIKKGKVLICPSDTVYGLVCDVGNKKAVKKLFKIKQRPENKPIPIFVKDIEMAKRFAKINKKQEEFLKKVWPGKTTVILKSKKGGTIGLRIPNNKFVLDSVKHIGPLAESSANISGQLASTKIKEVLKYFEGKEHQPNLVLDAGNLKKSKPSKVIDLTVWPPKILRQ